MGRKSSRKKNRLEDRALREQENNRQKRIANLIVFPGVSLFLWGFFLFDKTFISYRTQIIITLIGAAIGITVLHFLWRQKKYGLSATLCFGFFLGGPVPYSFIATTNYYLRENSENVRLEILNTGNRSRRGGDCKTPYAVIEYQNVKKDILFDCHYQKTISNYKSLMLTVSKGFWGYTVYLDKKINE